MRAFSVLAVAATVMLGQAPAEFEVVSIKIHPEPITMSSNMTRGNGYRGVAIKLLDLIGDAYGVHRNQISGGPSWAATENFDVDAKASGTEELTLERARPMLQAMLADRFQ